MGLSISLIFLLVIFGWLASEVWLYLIPTSALPEKIFRRLYKISHRIGIPLQPCDTAFEFARKLNRYLDILSKESRWSNWILINTAAIDQLTDIFVGHLFSISDNDQFDKIEFISAFRRIRRLLWFLWILTRLYRLKLLRPILGSNVRRFVIAIHPEMR